MRMPARSKPAMSKAGIGFMSDGAERNIASAPLSRDFGGRVEHSIAACPAKAADKGIGRRQIEEDIGEIGDYVRDAMHQAAAERHSDAAEDEQPRRPWHQPAGAARRAMQKLPPRGAQRQVPVSAISVESLHSASCSGRLIQSSNRSGRFVV